MRQSLLPIIGPRLCQLRRLGEQTRASPVVGRQRQPVRQKAEQRGPVAGGLIGAGKQLDRGRPAGGVVEQVHQAVARTGECGVSGECLRVPQCRGRAIALLGPAQVSQAHEESEQVSLFLLPSLRAQGEPIGPAFNLGQQIEQPVGGFRIISPGLQQLLQGRDGLSRLAQVQVLHLREL